MNKLVFSQTYHFKHDSLRTCKHDRHLSENFTLVVCPEPHDTYFCHLWGSQPALTRAVLRKAGNFFDFFLRYVHSAAAICELFRIGFSRELLCWCFFYAHSAGVISVRWWAIMGIFPRDFRPRPFPFALLRGNFPYPLSGLFSWVLPTSSFTAIFFCDFFCELFWCGSLHDLLPGAFYVCYFPEVFPRAIFSGVRIRKFHFWRVTAKALAVIQREVLPKRLLE